MNEPGTLYRRNPNEPKNQEVDQFFISQYPTYFGERGRIVVDLWNNSEIIGVVSTFAFMTLLAAYTNLTSDSSKVSE
jgi:hypothetical protein